ncbi:hypothetical protein EDB81DRAFT_891368 [Dactylonectria macrodidyma]|uniref:Glucose-methanol-choline oxidoreductase N-terminal domain-containing protein n=1 Tax=Dactylonectria macrodidyma TaxID=307937 RepID=A0A9P9DJW4_9HYPO|nr:hypothetical protein EDB81DRAFT_891368 [Dactylonectria macrodidyma]
MRLVSLSGLTALALAMKATASTYDYIVVGGGPAGIITAERLSEANKKVLLLERGSGPTPSVASISGTSIIICDDTPGYSACVLGGGVTVNHMVFVHPAAHDFNDKWPRGWKWKNVAPAARRLYNRNPGTTLPSENGKRYDQGLYSTLSGFFRTLGWKKVDMIKQPDAKHQVYSYPSWNIKDAERAGPVRTYLPLAQERDNFTLRLKTKVIRLVRSGSKVTSVEVENSDGTREIVKLNKKGRVVLSAGALSTPRVLFNSGIGPKAQIITAKKTGVALPPKKDWIELPVGKNLKDHPIFSIIVNTGESWGPLDTASVLNGTDTSNINLYEGKASGVLTQGRHRMIFFSSNVGSDGITRYYQGSCAASAKGVVTITQYMTHGLTSTGVLGLAEDGSTVFEQSPYLQTDGDVEAATSFIQGMVDDITDASTGFKLRTYTNTSAILGSLTSGIHYTGTAKMGTDDGRKGGSSVVDTNTNVYGMDNLFISDASIHPDLPTGNSQAIVMVVAEMAAAKILAYN